MDVETEVLRLSVTKATADALRARASATNASIHNLADGLLRAGLYAPKSQRPSDNREGRE